MIPEASGGDRPSALFGGWRAALGVLSLAGVTGYTVWVHYGIGAAPGRVATEWWHPTHFLLEWDVGIDWLESPGLGLAALVLPAGLLACCVFVGTRSALARMWALSCAATVGVFAFYGLYARFAWNFFHWRGSLTMVLTGLAVGSAVAAPLLAAAWRRHGFWPGFALYSAACGVVVAALRGATGTDEQLPFSISPWPAIPVFGLEIGAFAVAGVMLGLAVGAIGIAQLGRRKTLGLALLGAGAALPVGWLWLRFGAPPAVILQLLGLAMLVGLGLVGVTLGPGRKAVLERRALHLALGATLVIAPLFCGRSLATGDYTVSRFVRAAQIIDGLQAYQEEREVYPDRLEELVEGRYLERVPRPRVGFPLFSAIGWVPRPEFGYQNLGSSYVLELVATEWVQCAYNPPWIDDEEEEDDPDEDDESSEAWSCPDSRPKLW